MKTINNTELKVIKKEDCYEIYINNVKVDSFQKYNTDCEIEDATEYILNALLGLKMDREQLQNHLIENYLENIENMTNPEFAAYLIGNLKELSIHKDKSIVCYKNKNKGVYNIRTDDINYINWHNGFLVEKTSFCKFNGVVNTPSKGNRKKFVDIVKKTIEYLEYLEYLEY